MMCWSIWDVVMFMIVCIHVMFLFDDDAYMILSILLLYELWMHCFDTMYYA